jgi:hypothetical protein
MIGIAVTDDQRVDLLKAPCTQKRCNDHFTRISAASETGTGVVYQYARTRDNNNRESLPHIQESQMKFAGAWPMRLPDERRQTK